MQEYVICEKEDLVAMADAVREATGDVETYSVPELRDALINSYKNLSGGSMSEAQIIEIVEKYLNDNPIETGATEEEAAQIQQNKQDIETLNREKLNASELPEAVNDALADAKANGEFKGDPGIGIKGVTLDGVTANTVGKEYQLNFKTSDGKSHPVKFIAPQGEKGDTGDDYVLTDEDKHEIAEQAAEMVEVPECDAVKTVNGVEPDENGDVTVSAMPNDLEQLTILVNTDMLPAVHIGGAILTDTSGRIILRY